MFLAPFFLVLYPLEWLWCRYGSHLGRLDTLHEVLDKTACLRCDLWPQGLNQALGGCDSFSRQSVQLFERGKIIKQSGHLFHLCGAVCGFRFAMNDSSTLIVPLVDRQALLYHIISHGSGSLNRFRLLFHLCRHDFLGEFEKSSFNRS